jgi:signal transduction histidine kinase
MPTGKRKIGTILLLYSLAVTLLLLIASFIFIKTAAPPKTALPDVFFAATKEQVLQSFQSGTVSMRFNASVVSSSSIQDYYISELFRYFPFILVTMFAVITFGTWVLWRVLGRQSDRQAAFIASELSSIDDRGAPANQNPAIQKSYEEIKSRMDAYVGDYIRLNSYITHEQKNILSLLRAKLQLAGNAELVAEVDKVTASINDVLTLSASKSMEHEDLVDAALICADACDDYRKAYPKIRFHFDDEGSYQIRAREMWVSRAVCNLLDNAVKYGGTGPIDVSVKSKKGSVVITVTDHGCGIDEESQEKLFDSRYRISHLKKDGYGIGLNLVKHVCELCGGIVWVESAPGEGSTFYMVFPQALTVD